MATSRRENKRRKENSLSSNSNEIYRLSRLDLIDDEINETTPNLVIYEIATSHGLVTELNQANFDNKILLNYIKETTIKVVKEPITRDGWRYIARYVNPQVGSWKEGNKLKEAFQFIYQHRHLDLSKIPTNFIAGQQSPDQLYSFNSCLLYGLCVKYNLLTWPSMGYEELAFAVRSLLVSPNFLLNQFYQQLQLCQQDRLINLCLDFYKSNHLQPTLPLPEDVSYEQLGKTLDQVTDVYFLQERCHPQQRKSVV